MGHLVNVVESFLSFNWKTNRFTTLSPENYMKGYVYRVISDADTERGFAKVYFSHHLESRHWVF